MGGMILIFLTLFSAFVFADECETPGLPVSENLELANTLCLFSKPLIIGASVSAGYGTSSGGPASILSRALNPDTEIINIAFNGATSDRFMRGTPKNLPSLIMGLDMFFWDTVLNRCGGDYEQETRNFFECFQSRGVPMVIGKIPTNAPFPIGVRLAGTRPCTTKINRLLDELCTPEKNCLLYDPNDCFRAMRAPSSTSGQSYFLDQIHTSTAGNTFCAREFMRRAEYKSLNCKARN
jgi:hypothetical protein